MITLCLICEADSGIAGNRDGPIANRTVIVVMFLGILDQLPFLLDVPGFLSVDVGEFPGFAVEFNRVLHGAA